MFKHRKPKKLLSLFLVMTLFCAVLPGVSLADEPIDSGSITTVPSMYDPMLVFPNYAAATTYQEKLAAVQLPEASLEIISTEALVDSILSIPLLAIDIFSANDRKYGDALDYVAHWYNAVTELNTRTDSGTVLLEKYASLDFEELSADNGDFAYLSNNAPLILELLLGRDVHFARLTATQKETLFRTAAANVSKKQTYGVGNAYPNLFLSNLGDAALDYYAANVAQPLGDTSSSDYESETIKTYGGRSFTGYRWVGTYDYYAENHGTINSNYISQYPGISCLSSATEKYNCHSYAWHTRSSSNTIWINDPGTYISCSSSSETAASAGAIVVYYSSSGSILHSGVVSSVSGSTITVTSKWGDLPLYSHTLENVPNSYKTSSGTVSVRYFSYTVHKYDGWRSQNDTNHYPCCSLCYEQSGSPVAHVLSYSDPSATKHSVTCSVCDYDVRKDHGFTDYISVDETYHMSICSGCGYQKTEVHTLNDDKTKCTGCGYTGPFSVIMSAGSETELLAEGNECLSHEH